ncbi:MAG: ComF family protein [Clostridium sp.]|nr:ComF family protein [Clostridium sp.]
MKMIRGLKYHRKKELAYHHAKLMYAYWKELNEDKEEYIIVPVPMHKTREKQRGYNHMNLIAQEFAKLSGYEINTNLIYRTKNTTPQYALSKEERESNLKNAFGINTKNIKLLRGKKILILDDIITTGTTIFEMVSTLRGADYHLVKAFTASCSEFNIN